MPAVGPQGSRGGLITAVAIFTILFVTSTIFAIYFGVDDNKKTDTITQLNGKIKEIYSANDLVDPHYKAILDNRLRGRNATSNVLESSWQEAKQLADFIGGPKHPGTTTQPTVVIEDARAAIAAAANLPGVAMPSNPSLLTAMNVLTRYANGLQTQVAVARATQAEAAGSAATQIKNAQDEVQKAEADAAKAAQEKQDALDRAQKAEDHYQELNKQTQLAIDKERQGFNEQLKKVQAVVETKDAQIANFAKQNDQLTTKLAVRRVSVIDPIMRQPDGVIVSVASDDIVYINLGSGDHIVNGMTFEVYNQREGIPKQDDLMSADNLPVGVGALEVERVDAFTSQCRVIKTEVGARINPGDLIANLVYDRNTRYNFFVYGAFDLGQTGITKAADALKMKALVTQWGGKNQNHIDVNTDFVVLGAEPVMKTFTDEDLQDPLNVRQNEDQKKALADYNAQLDLAKQLHIPIMNQNRFLYFCGYYDNAQR